MILFSSILIKISCKVNSISYLNAITIEVLFDSIMFLSSKKL